MRKVFISAGHTNVAGKDRGASGNGFIEGELAVDLRNRVAHALRTSHGIIPIQDGNGNALAQTMSWIRNLTTDRCICLDIHWNAATPQAKGTETLVDSNANTFELSLAEDLSKAVATTIGTSLRGNFRGRLGVKSEAESHHGRLGWFRFTGQQVLLEVCFITNAKEMEMYIAKRDAVAKEIANVIANYAKK
jgi:N-acetylmuramoyl-L-alanine amidase